MPIKLANLIFNLTHTGELDDNDTIEELIYKDNKLNIKGTRHEGTEKLEFDGELDVSSTAITGLLTVFKPTQNRDEKVIEIEEEEIQEKEIKDSSSSETTKSGDFEENIQQTSDKKGAKDTHKVSNANPKDEDNLGNKDKLS